ncbi:MULTISPECIES: cellulase family glycosylhydrolase [unclassified Fibrobacter]|uniref:cellulase family glycosylhydrolase n=1 Tax=unclassified Fibrobacter TaxID=2634177 RepID=UPI000D6B6982|nr:MULTISPECIES: cellulase family glycosylhydrolase [unclassified Fibrobacter]PWJ64059.1 putative secreted protein (Por secretion system target) [Fibrobacter sp. UWR4]PZW69204.1 putative secreted protein (Por secretion system target) [Fibrobacter sp. UWR1]
MKKLFGFGILVAGLLASAFGANRIGPVSQYGQLQAGKNSSGKGQIYGACKGVSAGNEVQVQGMSLFWSIASDVGAPFWKDTYVNGLVEKQNIQVIRAPMGVDEDWSSGHYFSSGKTSYYQGLMNNVVQAAIANDIYVIIDYHSHHAHENVENAKTFFRTMAEKYGKYDNVIFEVYNEPLEGVSWSTIKTYAEAVISEIRKYSDNLVVVGNRSWDQYSSDAISSPINDKNVAYTFHFYAGSHSTNGEGANAVRAMNAGLSVFVTEWGTVDASGNGGFSKNNSATWLSWMNQHKLSGANWSVSNKPESASYFSGSAWNYSESGEWVNENVFAGLPKTYTACDGSTSPASSSSAASSSSVVLPAGYIDYIDDIEDGDSLAYTGGVWYAYNDNENGASSTFSNATNKDGYKVVLAGSTAGNISKNVAGLTGVKLNQGSYEYDPFVALGVKLNADESAYDLSKCNTISYKYRGAAHNFKAEDTAVKDYGYHQIAMAGSSDWTTAEISWDELLQDSWPDPVALSKSRINKFTWEIKGSQPFLNYLYIDDVRCSGWSIKKPSTTAASSSSVNSSSSSAVSSSSVASSSSRTPLVTTFSTTDKTVQSVVAGDAIEPIVYTFENVTDISASGLPNGITAKLDETAKTYTLSGKVDATSGTHDYAYTISVTGVDENKTVTGTIKVTRAPVVTTFSTTDKTVQSVVAGDAIEPIVYTFENVTNISVSGLPVGIKAVLNETAKTYTLSGTVDAESGTFDYKYVISVTGVDENKTATGTIKVTRAPVKTTFTTTSETEQSVVAGDMIEPIVFKYENMKSISATGMPKGLTSSLDEKAKTYTISGKIDASSATHDYEISIAVTGVDENTSAKVLIKVTALPPASSSSVESSSSEEPVVSSSSEIPPVSSSSVVVASSSSEPAEESSSSSIALEISSSSETVSSSSVATYVISGSLDQTVAIGGEIEPIVITGVEKSSRKSWNINFLSFPQQATDGQVVISGTVASWAPVKAYVDTIKVNGELLFFNLTVLPKSSSSAKSSSSEKPLESSSSVEVPPQSSSSLSGLSSSSEQPVISSSSSLSEISSSSVEQPQESSSSDMEGPLTIAGIRSMLNLGFSGNALTVSANNGSVKIQIFDLMGNAIESRMERVSGSYVMNLEHLNKGSYLVRVVSGSLIKSARIAIK